MRLGLPLMCALTIAVLPATVSAKSPADTRLKPAATQILEEARAKRIDLPRQCHHDASKSMSCTSHNLQLAQRQRDAGIRMADNH